MVIFIILLSALTVLILWAVLVYNGLVAFRNRVENAWRQIDVQLKRRHDLIPNLVNTVKGAMEFEKETLGRVIEARGRAVAATTVGGKSAAEGALTEALGRLFAVVESYPEIKSNRNALALQEEIASTENRIGFARQFYNDLAAQFNTKRTIFPSVIIASLFAFKRAEYFQAEDEAKKAPVVDFGAK